MVENILLQLAAVPSALGVTRRRLPIRRRSPRTCFRRSLKASGSKSTSTAKSIKI